MGFVVFIGILLLAFFLMRWIMDLLSQKIHYPWLVVLITLYDTPVFQTDGVRFSSKEEQAMRA